MENSNSKSLAEDLLINLSNQRLKGEFCDVQLTNGLSKLWAHSCVLATVSPFIMRYFVKHLEQLTEWSVKRPVQLNIATLTKCKGESKNNCMECVTDTVDYIYTGKIKLKEKHLDHVINLSNNLELENLLLICQKFKDDNRIDVFKPLFPECDTDSVVDPFPIITLEPDDSLLESPDYSNETINDNKSDDEVSVTEVADDFSCEDFSCETCGYRSQNDELFLMHDFILHRYDFTCISCNFEDKSISRIIEHIETHPHDSTVCSLCLYCAEDSLALKEHLKEHKSDKPYKCENCLLRFSERSDWLKHFSAECRTRPFNFTNANYKTEDSCPICKFSFPNESITKKHIRVFHKNKYTCLSCEYSTHKLDKIVNHLKVLNHLELYCSVCLYEAKTKLDLLSHVEEHLQKCPFKCKPCRVSYPNRRQWWRHMSSHYDEKPFSCSNCQLKFKNKTLLNTHVLRVHKNKKYICTVCGLAAPFPSLLEIHQKSHKTPKNLFACTSPNCDFKTNYKSQLVKHKKVHNVKPEENKSTSLQCSICKIFFSLEKNLNRHMKFQHNSQAQQFKCPKCSYFTVRLDKIKEHCIKVHCMDETESSNVIKLLKVSVPIKPRIRKTEKVEPIQVEVEKRQYRDLNREQDDSINETSKIHSTLKQNPQEETPKIVHLRIEEDGKVFVESEGEKTIENHGEFTQLQVDDNGNVVIQRLSQMSENSTLRQLQVCEDGSAIIQETLTNEEPNLVQMHNDNVQENENFCQLDLEEMRDNVIQELSNNQGDSSPFDFENIEGDENGTSQVQNVTEDSNFSQLQIEEIDGNTIIQGISDTDNPPNLSHENDSFAQIQINDIDDNSVLQGINQGMSESQINSRDFVNDSVKKTLFLNKTTGEINIISSSQGKPIPIASVTATNLLTIGNFREGTGSVTLNETTGVLTLNNINSGSTGAVFLNESTGELSYIDLNRENSEELLYPQIENMQVEYREIEQTQLDEVTGEIIKVNDKNHESRDENNMDDIFDFDMENFNEDSFDGFDDFDELLFDNVGMENYSEHHEDYEIQRHHFMMPGSQTPRLDEMTGEFTFDETSCSTQDIWNELRPFRGDVEDDSILENVNNGSYNFLLNEITGEFYK